MYLKKLGTLPTYLTYLITHIYYFATNLRFIYVIYLLV